ncbi:MAG: hypothetical protein FJW38_25530 [Acidobacteria bacterium]|nr:hypothetical protein [Acidobacteriota bacterium]
MKTTAYRRGNFGLVTAAKPFDWFSYAFTVCIVLLSSAAASAWPAIRASRIDPIIALRED